MKRERGGREKERADRRTGERLWECDKGNKERDRGCGNHAFKCKDFRKFRNISVYRLSCMFICVSVIFFVDINYLGQRSRGMLLVGSVLLCLLLLLPLPSFFCLSLSLSHTHTRFHTHPCLATFSLMSNIKDTTSGSVHYSTVQNQFWLWTCKDLIK